MDSDQMANRCPSARHLGTAVLRNHRFRIDGRGVATIVPEQGAVVLGVVWDLAESDLSGLDAYEGVPKFYTRQHFQVEFEGSAEEMLVYVSANADAGRGRSGYMDRIIDAAQANHFPKTYLTELKSWMSVQGS